ncbi:arginyl-tRNA synthetase [Paenibacillus shirakamiensis]|uniref:Arginine--tRNA ligase n=1 Tax=Paenibacillus shirakamiensis TaxID=1265935 RepID=A0ABS4JFG5_9BACL|nr:arginine--tRNA ligase [Paenibacillus shirakamiensis]MBP2000438.1 arginyl-tRNA synthetase [Paenibacillus shirakamiensis]
MLSHIITTHLTEAVQHLYQDQNLNEIKVPAIQLEQPAHIEHGDYSSSIALQLAKSLRTSPMIIAGWIKEHMDRQQHASILSKVEVVAPGFINCFVDWNQWVHIEWESPPLSTAKVVVEHTSINPNKSAHIGHLRNACIGDTLVRMLRKTGHTVEVHNYIDDLGNQLADTLVGMLHVPLQAEYDRFGDYCWDLYGKVNRLYEAEPEFTSHRVNVLHALEEGHSNLAWMGELVAERMAHEHIEEMRQFGITYDLLVWESHIVRGGFWSSAFELLQKTPLFQHMQTGKLAGCWVLRQDVLEDQTDEDEYTKDKVLVRSNGILTYTAKDIAYHLWKFGLLHKDFAYRPFENALWTTHASGIAQAFGQADRVINVIDYRQHYPQTMVRQALELLGYTEQADQLQHVSYGVVSLSPASAVALGIDISEGKSSYAMSGRQGIGVKITDLITLMEKVIEKNRSDRTGLSSRDIATASIRYYVLRFNLQTEIIFDFNQATEISGNTGVYLLYAYARASSVLRKAEEQGFISATPQQMPSLEKAEYALLRHISTWQDTLLKACEELTPHTLCSYANELSALFSNFYALCPILKSEREQLHLRLWLTEKFKDTLGEALEILGLPKPVRM